MSNDADVLDTEALERAARDAFRTEIENRMGDFCMTKAALARILGVTPGRVTRMLSGDSNMEMNTCVRLCAALGLKFDFVFSEIEPR